MKTITTEEKTPDMLREILGVDETTANFILAIETDKIESDIANESENKENPTFQ